MKIFQNLTKRKLIIFIISFSLYIPIAQSQNITSSQPLNNNKQNATSNQNVKNISQSNNAIFPSYQEILPLISLGQTIVEKNDLILLLYGRNIEGAHKRYTDTAPTLIYGFSDRLSFLLSAPIAISFNENHFHSSGAEDLFLQLEYAYFTKENSCFSDQATIVGAATLPAGSPHKQPPTGLGSSSYLLGTTFTHSYKKWSIFTSPGIFFRTTYKGIKPGDDYLYQFGGSIELFSRNVWKIIGLMEFDGQYTKKTTISGMTDPNSGGNIVLMTPSLSVTSDKLLIQFGTGFPIIQHLNGNQNRNHYLLLGDIGYTF